MLHRPLAASLVALTLACAAGTAAADAAGAVKYRQAIMKGNAAHLVAISQIVKGAVSHPNDLLPHAKALEANVEMVTAAFKEKAMEGETRATDKIWSDWSGFEAKAQDTYKAAETLVDAIESNGDVAAALKSVGQACGGCHKEYRKRAN